MSSFFRELTFYSFCRVTHYGLNIYTCLNLLQIFQERLRHLGQQTRPPMRGQMVPPGQLPPRQAQPGQPVPIEGYQQMPPGQPVGQPRTAIRGPNGQLVSLYEDICMKCLCTVLRLIIKTRLVNI